MKSVAIHIMCWIIKCDYPTIYCKEIPMGSKSIFVSIYKQYVSDRLYQKREELVPGVQYIPVYDCACIISFDNGLKYFVSI